MKKISLSAMLMLMAVTITLVFISCQETDLDGIVPVSENVKSLPDHTYAPVLIMEPKGLNGKTYEEWSQDWWRYVMGFDCAHNPLNIHSLTGQADGSGNLVFLVGTERGSAIRNIEVFGNAPLFVPVINVLKDYPGSYLHELPKPGQTIEQFLKAKAAEEINLATNMKATLDGHDLRITKENRIATDQFYFRGNKDLKNCMDASLTGQSQPAVSDGYWLTIQNLKPGRHVLKIHAEIPSLGIVTDVVYNLSTH